MTECVLCDWKLDLTAEALAVYLPGSIYPLHWTPEGPKPVSPSALVFDTMGGVATVHHWATQHPMQLLLAIGPKWETDTWPRQSIYGSMAAAPPAAPPPMNATELQDAINAADAAGGGTVHIPAGTTIEMDGPVHVPAGTSIEMDAVIDPELWKLLTGFDSPADIPDDPEIPF